MGPPDNPARGDNVMARIIEFHIPADFKAKINEVSQAVHDSHSSCFGEDFVITRY
jgi:hypothetical protein